MTKSEKQSYILKLMVIAINEAIKKGAITLEANPDGDKRGHMMMDIAGRRSVLNWFDAGYEELRISLWWHYTPEMMPTYRKKWLGEPDSPTPGINRRFFRNILGACGTCYLERKTGKFIIGDSGSQFSSCYVREDSAPELDKIAAEEPAGYKTHGWIQS